jgi:signal transduction histidine kinase/ligand-binding sensor domain-containing protein/DNA-binding response OmpR family regulator
MAKYVRIFFFSLFFPVFISAQYDNPSIPINRDFASSTSSPKGQTSTGQAGQGIKFEHISVEQGLSNAEVHDILQDDQGFMWFATKEGLNKYDGYKFTTYLHDPTDSTSLGSNNLTSLYEDPSGNLWISTIKGGLNKYIRETDNFISYKPQPDKPGNIISDVLQQTAGFNYNGKAVLWVGTQYGLNKLDLSTQKFKYYPHTQKGFPYTYIESLVVDSSGLVWMGCTEGGLYKFDPASELFTNYQHDPKNPYSISSSSIVSLWLDRSGILWIGTTEGLNKFDPEKERFIRYQPDPQNPRSLSQKFLVAIYEDGAGNLWVGTATGGLNKFDPEMDQFRHYKFDPANPNSLSDNTVTCIYQDKSDVLWVGTWNGISKSDPGKVPFSNYVQIAGNRNSLNDNYITSILESDYGENKILWIGTKTGGLNKLDRKSGIFTHYMHDPGNPKSIPGNTISALFEDRTGILWIGTWGQGLIKYDSAGEQFTQYINQTEYPVNIGNNIIRTIFEDKEGILWIGTQSGGLFKFDRNTGQFKAVGYKTQIMHIYEDKSGQLWIAATSGLKKLDRDTEQFISYWHNPDDPNSISSNGILSIHEDKRGTLWFGTAGGGLNKYNPVSGKFVSYTSNDGLPNDVINGILEDTQGNIWLSTNNGLARFNPQKETFRNYDVSDGLSGNQFYTGAFFRSKNGEMFFGSTKGLIAFYPDRLKDNPHIPEIVISGFQIFNKPVALKTVNKDEQIDLYTLPKPISFLQEIEISYKENIFTFEFAALDFRSPQKNQYAYKMDGVDPDWVFTDASRRFATYTNLDPGEYTFRVRGSNNDGIWNDEGTSIKVIILPPWWKTNWAYFSYFVLFILLFYFLRHYELKRQRLKQELKMEHQHAETLAEVDKMKSRFFANISHEFRTPLTLILGPVKQMLAGEFIGNFKEQYNIIIRNGERLLKLINQLLELSKVEAGEMKLQVGEIDIIKYLKGMVLSFSSLAERKKIILNLNIKNKEIIGFIDNDKFEKIITNLLSNAFKFTPQSGMVEVAILMTPLPSASPLIKSRKTGLQGGTRGVQISITNSGPGIPAHQLDKIFDRFYQAPMGQTDDNYKKDSEGSGIGLALTKELVEVCHGKISVSSIPEKTTTFDVILPVNKESFKEDEIVKELETADRRQEIEKQIPIDNKKIMSKSDSSSRPPVSGFRSPVILIVEDNPDVTNYISSFMEKDYRIITAENGKIGFKKTLDKYPDLIISDVMMPEMDGFELCQKIKSDERISHIPIILLTAKADLDSKIDGLEYGADDYVTKPFEARELQIRSKNLIEQRRKLREKFSLLIDIKPEDIAASSMDEQLLQRLLAVFEDHIEEPEFSIEQLANEIGMSRMHLNRKIQAITNLTTSDFIRTLRLQRAAKLLRNASGTVSEIAYKVGFNNLSYFSRAFRKHFGKLPSDFSPTEK